jgi:hypothetical protein
VQTVGVDGSESPFMSFHTINAAVDIASSNNSKQNKEGSISAVSTKIL